jgi:hypothetical protein
MKWRNPAAAVLKKAGATTLSSWKWDRDYGKDKMQQQAAVTAGSKDKYRFPDSW